VESRVIRFVPAAWMAVIILGCFPLPARAGIAAALEPPPRLSVNARQAGAYEPSTGAWLYEKGAEQAVPIASLTKIAAALTYRRLGGDLDTLVAITREDWLRAGRTKLRVGDRVPARTLLKLALVASDNCAARALTHAFGLTLGQYAQRMTETARYLGCRRAAFAEPTGLDSANVACVRDVVTLFASALQDSVLREYLGTEEFTLATERGPRPVVHSARLLRYRGDVIAAKTGYTDVAGYCLIQCAQDERSDIITVVLGAPTKGARSRESLRLLDYARNLRDRKS
jgi:D-alanyl-D-alanine endopeptidase (penicillin-binding protein 7)